MMKSEELSSIYQLDVSSISEFIYGELDESAIKNISEILKERVPGTRNARNSKELFSRINLTEKTRALSIYVERRLQSYKTEIVATVCVEYSYCDFIETLKKDISDPHKILIQIYQVLCDLMIGFPTSVLTYLTVLLVHSGILKKWCECE